MLLGSTLFLPFLELHNSRLKRPSSFMNVSSMQNGLEDATTLHPIHHSETLLQTLLLYMRIIRYSMFYFMVNIVGNFTII